MMSHGRQEPGTTDIPIDEELENRKRYQDFSTIDWVQDAALERNRRLRNASVLQRASRGATDKSLSARLWLQVQKAAIAGQSWFVVSLAGVCIGVSAALISIVTEWLSDLKNGYCTGSWWLNQDFCCWEIEVDGEEACDTWKPWSHFSLVQWIIYVLFSTLFSLTAAHLVKSFAKYAAGSGISEIKCILAGFVMKGYLGVWTFVIKALTLPLVIASGLSVGKEGPSVHVACCIGYIVASMFSRFSRSQGKMREIVTAASAAGVAVAFGSPIGGVLFSVEEMSHSFSIKTLWRSFFCALVATVTLSAMNPFRTGKLVLFQVTYDRDWHFFEIVFFVIIGAFGGLYGALVVKFNLQVASFRRKFLANHAVAEAVLLATFTAVIAYWNQFLRMDMTESLYILFRECEGGGDYDNLCQTSAQWRMLNSLFLATIFRVILVIISYGCKVPAGIFVPSMAIGATFGRFVGIIVKAIYRQYPQSGWFAVCDPDLPCITPGTYALLGAAAALGGVMRITVSVVVIMFELTGALTYILPTMIVLLVTKAVGDWIGVRGIADEMIKFNGYPFLEDSDHAFNIPVSRVMRRELFTMPEAGTLSDVEARLEATTVQGFPVVTVTQDRTLLGYIGRTELTYLLDKARLARTLSPGTVCSFVEPDDETPPTRRPNANRVTPASPMPQDHADAETLLPASWSASGGLGIDEVDEEVELGLIGENGGSEGLGGDLLRLGPWVNQAPITVNPQMSLEIVMQLFKRLGPRVILVEKFGSLVGLITVKDVLRFIELEEATHRTTGRRQSLGSRLSLEEALEEAWMWITDRTARLFR